MISGPRRIIRSRLLRRTYLAASPRRCPAPHRARHQGAERKFSRLCCTERVMTRASSPSPYSSSSSSSPPSRASSYWCGSGSRAVSSWVVVVCIVVPLLVVSFLVFGFDSRTPPSWFSSSYSLAFSSSSPWAGEDHPPLDFINPLTGDVENHSSEQEHDQLERGVSSSPSSYVSHFSVPPVAAPSPAPEPKSRFFEDSKSKDKVTLLPRVRKGDLKLERLELGLARARRVIREAVQNRNQTSALVDKDYTPRGHIYRNAYVFHRSYLEMEKLFKVHVYEEGEPPIFHDGPCGSIYASEGRFIHNMEMETHLRTRDPDIAHVHFLPYSVVKMVQLIYESNSHDRRPLQRTIVDYINVIAGKYPYWNRSLGADHFMLSCHDWGPFTSSGSKYLFRNSIRVLCNANTSEGFNPSKDVSLPEINIKNLFTEMPLGGPSASGRPILAFFAGGNHGPVRPLLFKHWGGRDKDVEVHEYLPKSISYADKMKMSKFCLCPSGTEVASPRIVEAIYSECVPVTISKHYVLPFSDVLNWKAFSVQISLEDIPNIKKILTSIPPRQYIRMQRTVKMVQRHFTVSTPPKRYDAYHMILHSIWLRRLNVRIHPEE